MNQPHSAETSVQPIERPAWQRYGFALVVLLLALLARRLLDPYTTDAIPLATIYMAVAFAVWFGGWKPAALVIGLGYVAGLWWFYPPRETFKGWATFGTFRSLIYFSSCAITVYLCESMRRAQRRHAASEAGMRAILEHMREGFCAIDATWRLTGLNRSAQSMLGLPAAAPGRSWWDVAPRLAGTAAEAELRRALRERVAVQFETDALAGDAWHAVAVSPAADGGLKIFLQDVTATKAQVERLERLVAERTLALQRTVADLETFSYTLVHDMRAPLRWISSFADILATDHAAQLDAEGKRHLDRIRDSAQRMDRLIMDVLGYSRLGRRQHEVREVNLDETIRELLRTYPDFQAEKADVSVDGPLPRVRGNPALLTQCFSNLLQNATKFVAPGVKPRIRITPRVERGTARIEIADNGIGIAPEATARIFEPFQRENADYEGTGIGLAIVRKVMEQLDGRVGVESTPGGGSCFWIELQAAEPSPAAARETTTTR